MSGYGSSGSGLSVTLTARMRANPHTTTGHQAKPPPRPHSHRHCASPSSHDGTRPGHTDGPEPPQPPLCEPILTQRPSGPPNRPVPATQTAIVRANPHTMPPQSSQTTKPETTIPPACEPIFTQPRINKLTHCPAPTHTAIVRVHPHTMTPNPAKPPSRPRSHRHSVSGSSHDDTQLENADDSKPSRPPLCE